MFKKKRADSLVPKIIMSSDNESVNNDTLDNLLLRYVPTDSMNQGILARLKRNDSNLTKLSLATRRWSAGEQVEKKNQYSVRGSELELKWLGYCIGRSTHLRVLCVGHVLCGACDGGDVSFCEGMVHNRSIEKIYFGACYRCRLFDLLLPFFRENTNLSEMHVNFDMVFDPTSDVDQYAEVEFSNQFAKSIEAFNGLKHFDLSMGNSRCGVVSILRALRVHNQLEELHFRCVDFCGDLCRELSLLMREYLPKLCRLDLSNNRLNDERMIVLVDALRNSNSIQSFDISRNSSITEIGWEQLAALVSGSNCTLEELYLDHCGIRDESALVFASALTVDSTMKKLVLVRGDGDVHGSNLITPRGWHAFVRVLNNNHQSQEVWCVNFNSERRAGMIYSSISIPNQRYWLLEEGTFDEDIGMHFNKLHSDQLRELDLSNNQIISMQGWRTLASLLGGCPSLEKLDLSFCNIDDDVIQGLVHSLLSSNLRSLDLSSNGGVTRNGWRILASLIENPNTQLRSLTLDLNDITNEEARVYANALTQNNMLGALSLSGTAINGEGWGFFAKTLCDTSSINNVYLSNHNLSWLGELGGRAAPNKLRYLLCLNDDSNCKCFFKQSCDNATLDSSADSSFSSVYDEETSIKATAAIKCLNELKRFDVTPLFEWNLKALPAVVYWFMQAKTVRMQNYLWLRQDMEYQEFSDYYVLPHGSFGRSSFYSMVDRKMLDAIYQFIRGNAHCF